MILKPNELKSRLILETEFKWNRTEVIFTGRNHLCLTLMDRTAHLQSADVGFLSSLHFIHKHCSRCCFQR